MPVNVQGTVEKVIWWCDPDSLKMYKYVCCVMHALIMQCIVDNKTPDASVDNESWRSDSERG